MTKQWLQRIKSTTLIAGAIGCLCGAAATAGAVDDPRTLELEKRLDENIKSMDALSLKVKELEEKTAAQSAPLSGFTERSFLEDVTWLHGFADAGLAFSVERKDPADRPRAFALGTFELFLTPQLGDRVKSLVELMFEFEGSGEMVSDMERLQLGYTFNDQATVWLGRFHTPYGYWNTGFHHGAQIQTSILRPRFIDFEDAGGIVPAHTVGLWETGAIGTGGGKVTYDLYVGNGPKINKVSATGGDGELDPNNVKDDNHNLAVGANIGYEFGGALEGLKLGTHWLRAAVDSRDDAGTRLDRTMLNMLGGYLYYNANSTELMGEFYQFLNRDETGASGTHSSWAGFLQAGYTLGRFTPYVRAEKTELDQSDNYFRQQKSGVSYIREAVGIRYDLNPKSAIKVEGNHTDVNDRATEKYDEIRVQYAIRF